MSKETEARDVALREYNKFMEKYGDGVEAGNMKLMQHMLRLEADKIRTQSILDSIEKSEAGLNETVYGNTKMKMQMSEDEYNIDQGTKKVDEREKAFIEMATRPITIGDPDKMDTYSLDTTNFGQVDANPKRKQEVKKKVQETSPSIEIDPKTGRKIYKGPKLRSRKIVDGKVWDESHPNFHDKNVGGM